VIVNRAVSIADTVDVSGCGVAVEGAAQIGHALDRIAKDYEMFSGNACAFFGERLDFGRAFADVIRRVDHLQGAA